MTEDWVWLEFGYEERKPYDGVCHNLVQSECIQDELAWTKELHNEWRQFPSLVGDEGNEFTNVTGWNSLVL